MYLTLRADTMAVVGVESLWDRGSFPGLGGPAPCLLRRQCCPIVARSSRCPCGRNVAGSRVIHPADDGAHGARPMARANAHHLVGTELATAGARRGDPPLAEAARGYPPAAIRVGIVVATAGRSTKVSRSSGITARRANARDPQRAWAPATRSRNGSIRRRVPTIDSISTPFQDANAWTVSSRVTRTAERRSRKAFARRRCRPPELRFDRTREGLLRAAIGRAAALEQQTVASIDDPAAHEILGRVLASTGRFEDARSHLERACDRSVYVPARDAAQYSPQ